MLGEQISTEGPKNAYCNIQCVPLASHGKDQLEITNERSLKYD